VNGSLVELITEMIVDHRFTYTENDVASGDVMINTAHNALGTRVRAHGRSHNRQKVVTVASLPVVKRDRNETRGGRRRKEGKKLGDCWEEREVGYTC
jgi:hypothetical protein